MARLFWLSRLEERHTYGSRHRDRGRDGLLHASSGNHLAGGVVLLDVAYQALLVSLRSTGNLREASMVFSAGQTQKNIANNGSEVGANPKLLASVPIVTEKCIVVLISPSIADSSWSPPPERTIYADLPCRPPPVCMSYSLKRGLVRLDLLFSREHRIAYSTGYGLQRAK